MRLLLAIVVLAALGYSGWWYWSATARDDALTGWLAERRADGWVAEAGDIRVTGYPSRVDAIVTDLELADPESGWSWVAPEFQILSLSYKPHHVIAVWPGEQTIASPFEAVHVESGNLRGSVVLEPNPGLALERSAIEIEELLLTADSGWQASIGSALLATRQAGDAAPPFAHDLNLEASDIVPPVTWAEGIDRAGVLPEAIEAANLDAVIVFDRPWDRAAVEDENPRLEQIRIRDVSLDWGRLDLRGRGTVAVDANGYAEGEVELRARNWREMLELAEAAGAFASGIAGPLRAGLGLIARLSGDPDTIEVPLTFADGLTRLGPIVLGQAPQLR